MRRVGHLFERVCAFDNLLGAFERAFRGSGRTREACRFHFRLEPELLALQRELWEGIYEPAPYRYFRILDPKERTISVAPFRDRVVHHALVGVLEPVFERRFLFDSYATRKGKGTHRAVRRAQQCLRRNAWFVKMDVARFFDSVDHGVLLEIVRRRIKDARVLDLVRRILVTSDRSRGLSRGKGLPIGNLTSQFFANVYLDPLDHFLKDDRAVPGYVRYMDDMVVFGPTRECVKGVLHETEGFLEDRLRLRLNPRATLLNRSSRGLPFLGFRVFPGLVRVRRENIRRLKGRMRDRQKALARGALTEEGFAESVRSLFAHAAFADSLGLRKALLAAEGRPFGG